MNDASMNTNTPLIFIHGLEGSSQGFKATMLRGLFPHVLTPDFGGPLEERMTQLLPILADKSDWVIIGSSFGGLMGTLFTCQHPARVKKLILLAPALTWPGFADPPPKPVSVPTVVYHGLGDTVVLLEPVRALCKQIFTNLTFHAVDDDHRLRETVQTIDWPILLG
ncbi:MAG: alpha/beta hydrolase [Chloroflexi bacterium]|nr:alpha/beta hydrolase [Chloroflexota bacterium]